MDPDNRCSVSGAVFLFAGCPGARGSNPLPPSSTEAAKGAIWLPQLKRDLKQDIAQLTSRLLDKQLLANPVHNSNTNTFDVRHHFIGECVANSSIVLKYVRLLRR